MRNGLLVTVCLAMVLAPGGCASRGEERDDGPTTSDRVDAARRGVADAAVTPLRDVGLIRPDIPAALAGIVYPYETAALAAGCVAVAYEIGQLDAVLGDESYQPGPDRDMMDRGADAASDAALGVVRDAAEVIPFRSWVRRASGATRAEREAREAFELGQLRRSFLRGYGASLGCAGVLPPPPPEGDDED